MADKAGVVEESFLVGQPTAIAAMEVDEGNCYCGKNRDLSNPELQCGICSKWLHMECTACYLGKTVPFVTNYQFICRKCNPKGVESFSLKQAGFLQICQAAVANLMFRSPQKTWFSKDREIIPYIDKNWELLTTMPRRIKVTWHQTVSKMLLKETDMFKMSERLPNDQHFTLTQSDLTKIGPNYDLLKAGYCSGKPGVMNLGNPITEPTKGRGTKRKTPGESVVAVGVKQKRGEQTVVVKLGLHGYPSEHPFNKDGYRYILAESDPHAPNRQAFDESLDWAGKPIPGYLYRTFLSAQVLLALQDRAPQLKVSEERLTVTGEKGYSMIRATHSVNRGSWYFEVNIDEMPPETATRIGWSQSLGNLQAPCGYDKFSYSWRSKKGTRFHQSRGKHYSDEYSEGDVLGFYIHLPSPPVQNLAQVLPHTYKDKPLVKFKSYLYYEEKDFVTEAEKNLSSLIGSKMMMYKNGENQGEAWTDVFSGSYFPAISLYKNAVVTANFGPTFKFPPNDIEYQPMSANVEQSFVESSLADLLYHVDHEGRQPEF